jgi:hypothetical protein
MRSLLKALIALWLGLLAAMPLFPEDGGGGGGGGGGGVWILPGSTAVTNRTGNNCSPTLARAHRVYNDLTKDISLELPPEMGDSLASLLIPSTGRQMSLPVDGHSLRLSSSLLTNLVNSGVTEVDILVIDANSHGLRFTVLFDLVARSVTIYVF